LPPSASHEKSLLQDLVISKTLRSYYKLPHQIAHSVLARRMYDRDPGSAPQVRMGHWVSSLCPSPHAHEMPREGVPKGRSPFRGV